MPRVVDRSDTTGDLNGARVPRGDATMNTMRDLDRLAAAAQAGNSDALDRFVRSIQSDVWRFCVHLTGGGDADDLAQEALLRVVTHLDRWERGPVHTWVLGVTRNVCFECVSKRSRRRAEPSAEPPMPPEPDARSAIETRALLAGLPVDQREALVLTQLLGLPYAAAAEVVGCPVGTIRSRVARGREALSDALRAGGDVAER